MGQQTKRCKYCMVVYNLNARKSNLPDLTQCPTYIHEVCINETFKHIKQICGLHLPTYKHANHKNKRYSVMNSSPKIS